jgi:DNA-binding HxlR family transcriptional regulator
MLKRDYDGQICSIAKALELVGERWTLLIVRDAFLGRRRFDEFQQSLGIARNVLTDRLNRLVEEGIFERVRYSERPERYDYRLTGKGRDLNIALAGLRQWGDKYLSEKPPVLLRSKSDQKTVVAALVREDADTLGPRDVELVPGPGAPD